MDRTGYSVALINPTKRVKWDEAAFLVISALGLIGLVMGWSGTELGYINILYPSLALLTLGIIGLAFAQYRHEPAGIKNNGVFHTGLTARGISAWLFAIFLTGIYVLIYWYPETLGKGEEVNSGLIGLFDPLSKALSGNQASEWFMYGTIYTLLILAFGIRFIIKYRHNRYQIVRTLSIMFFQLGFAFIIPEVLVKLGNPYFDWKHMWPLNHYFFDDWSIRGFISGENGISLANLGLLMFVFAFALMFLLSPLLTYFYGKRWYCSWVCGCGGLANTAGDSFRHLSDKSVKAWKIERWLIHLVLLFVIIGAIATLFSFYSAGGNYLISKEIFVFILLGILLFFFLILFFRPGGFRSIDKTARYIGMGSLILIAALVIFAYVTGSGNPFFVNSYDIRKIYGFYIGSLFAGVIGVGFYPLMGTRVWCRFGCPMAAILGFQQRFFSRFRITTNGGQCISCGNCSTYCEMGIDVKSYAQRGENIVRSSCVGCGICSAVCPRGVLKLENGPVSDRTGSSTMISRNDINIL